MTSVSFFPCVPVIFSRHESDRALPQHYNPHHRHQQHPQHHHDHHQHHQMQHQQQQQQQGWNVGPNGYKNERGDLHGVADGRDVHNDEAPNSVRMQKGGHGGGLTSHAVPDQNRFGQPLLLMPQTQDYTEWALLCKLR